jgi:hypothetical protein
MEFCKHADEGFCRFRRQGDECHKKRNMLCPHEPVGLFDEKRSKILSTNNHADPGTPGYENSTTNALRAGDGLYPGISSRHGKLFPHTGPADGYQADDFYY